MEAKQNNVDTWTTENKRYIISGHKPVESFSLGVSDKLWTSNKSVVIY